MTAHFVFFFLHSIESSSCSLVTTTIDRLFDRRVRKSVCYDCNTVLEKKNHQTKRTFRDDLQRNAKRSLLFNLMTERQSECFFSRANDAYGRHASVVCRVHSVTTKRTPQPCTPSLWSVFTFSVYFVFSPPCPITIAIAQQQLRPVRHSCDSPNNVSTQYRRGETRTRTRTTHENSGTDNDTAATNAYFAEKSKNFKINHLIITRFTDIYIYVHKTVKTLLCCQRFSVVKTDHPFPGTLPVNISIF